MNRAGLFAVFCCATDCSLHTCLHPRTSEAQEVKKKQILSGQKLLPAENDCGERPCVHATQAHGHEVPKFQSVVSVLTATACLSLIAAYRRLATCGLWTRTHARVACLRTPSCTRRSKDPSYLRRTATIRGSTFSSVPHATKKAEEPHVPTKLFQKFTLFEKPRRNSHAHDKQMEHAKHTN